MSGVVDAASVAPPPLDELAEVSLPPPRPLDVADRGFFAGDALRLELVVVDPRNGTPLWTKVVEGNVDPRDARAVRRLLDRALADEAGRVPASWQDAQPAEAHAMPPVGAAHIPANSIPLRRMTAPKATRSSPDAQRTATGCDATRWTRRRSACEPYPTASIGTANPSE